MKKLLLSLGLLLSLSLSLTGCDDNDANAQGSAFEVDFLIDILSGAVMDNPEGEGSILEIEVSQNTVILEETPGSSAGIISTEGFLENFEVIFGDELPNAVLTIRGEDGIVDAAAVNLNSVVFDTEQQIASFTVTPLEVLPGGDQSLPPLELTNIADVTSSFDNALLFIDSTKLERCISNCFLLPPLPGVQQICLIECSGSQDCDDPPC